MITRTRKSSARSSADGENPYWVSFSDIMAGLLVIFILALVTLMIQQKVETEKLSQAKIEAKEAVKQAEEAKVSAKIAEQRAEKAEELARENRGTGEEDGRASGGSQGSRKDC